MATDSDPPIDRYVSHTAPDQLIPHRLVELEHGRRQLQRDVTAYLVARQGFWFCLRHRQLRVWWRFR